MIAYIRIARLKDGEVDIAIANSHKDAKWTKKFGSPAEASEALLDMGIPSDALELYFGQLFLGFCTVSN
jgi:hypothetical protein